MDTSVRAALRAAALVALAAVYVNGQEFSCYNSSCTNGEQCSSISPDEPKTVCSSARSQCLTVIKRNKGIITGVQRSCISGIMMVNSVIGCKIRVNGADSEETCTCDGQDCNGDFQAPAGQPLKCVQCDYLRDSDLRCSTTPDDPSLIVSCPAANRCVTEVQETIGKNKHAIRYCGRWNGNDSCQRSGAFHDICFCQGDVCNNRLPADTLADPTGSKVATTSDVTTPAPSPAAAATTSDVTTPAPSPAAAASATPAASSPAIPPASSPVAAEVGPTRPNAGSRVASVALQPIAAVMLTQIAWRSAFGAAV